MRINTVNFMIAIAVSSLIAYGFWNIGGELRTFVAAGSFVYLAGTLGAAIGLDFDIARNGTNLRVVCGVFFVFGLILNYFFGAFGSSQTLYIMTNAITFLIFIFLGNTIYNARQ